MDILQAIVLGTIQGIGEFLPISSSGHLVLVPYIFNWQYQGLSFDIALHMGTLLAVLAYFGKDWVGIIGNAIAHDREKIDGEYPSNIFWIIMIASVPAAFAGYFLENLAENALRNPLLVAIMLIVFAILLWLADLGSKKNLEIKDIGYTKGFLIGVAQAISLFPGVSRSGVTGSAGLLLGLNREKAMRFSFLLATPAVLGAFVLTLNKFNASAINLPFIVAVATSAIFGFLSIKYLLKYLKNHGFLPFVIYRIALAALILIIYFTR